MQHTGISLTLTLLCTNNLQADAQIMFQIIFLIAVLTRFNCYIFQFDAVALVLMLLKRDSDDHNNDSNEMTSPMNYKI